MIDFKKELEKNSKDLSILAVEDDMDTLSSISSVLKNFFFNVQTAIDGEDGLEKYKKFHYENDSFFDIVITDINMPKLCGLTLSKEILKINSNQVIVVTTGKSDFEDTVEMINIGINYFLKKPISSFNLLQVLWKCVKYIKNERNLKEKTQELKKLNHTLEKKVEDQTFYLFHRLYFDSLTRLPKRNKLIEDIQKLDPLGMLIININDFKDVNSVYGHDAGDKVLVEFSRILFEIALDRGCNLYNTGGDEFVFLNIVKNVNEFCKETANFIISKIDEEGVNINIDGENVNISLHLTIGMTFTRKKENLLNEAIMALKYATKKRLPFFIYDRKLKLNEDSSNSIEIVNLIKKAISNDLIVPFFQPIFLNDGKVKYETLVRIVDENKTYSPALFLSIAQKIRYYHYFTKTVIEKSFKLFENRTEEFSINLSFEDIINNETIDFLENMLKKYNVNNRLIIEILESENIDDFNILNNFIQRVKSMGVKVAIDDFGSGYSNFSYLLQMKPDFIKIDGAIIRNIHIDENSFLITQSLVDFAKKLNAKTVAEFISSKEIYEKAKSIDIDAFQGFYLGEPKPALL